MATYQKGTPEWKIKNFAKCWERIEALEGNPFVRDMAEIIALANEAGQDIGVGRDKYIAKYYPTKELKATIKEEDIRAHKEICREFYPDYIVAVQAFMEATK